MNFCQLKTICYTAALAVLLSGIFSHGREACAAQEGQWLYGPSGQYYRSDSGETAAGTWLIDGTVYHFQPDGKLEYSGYGPAPSVPGLDAILLDSAITQTNYFWQDILYGLNRLNEIRASHGAPPLTLDRNLSVAASYRACEMYCENYFDHWVDGQLRADAVVNAMAMGSGIHATSENIYRWIYSEPYFDGYERIIDYGTSWYFGSPSHFNAMINPDYTYVGLGLYAAPDGQTYYYNMIFE